EWIANVPHEPISWLDKCFRKGRISLGVYSLVNFINLLFVKMDQVLIKPANFAHQNCKDNNILPR
ncbi:MAG: hypothetical protein KA272_03605, partial [Phocaeicola sp.]|nr:hypothetical protein [Phocaeicola sp.]